MQFKLYEKNEITLKNRMKTLKSILLLVLVTTFLISCGDTSETNDTTTNTAEPTTETTTTTGETPATTTTSISSSEGARQITDAVVQQACDCQEGARREDKTIDFSKVGECMGGKNKIEFVADLLGADASDKDRSDAEVALVEKMKAKCPQ
jgi:hypothetical protein